MRHLEAELVLDAKADLGEGPIWDVREQLLWWVDISRGELHRLEPSRGIDEATHLGDPVSAVAVRSAGGLLVALSTGLFGLDESGELSPIAAIEADRIETRLNDGKCDRSGRFWVSSMARDMSQGAGRLYVVDMEHRVRQVLAGLTIGNGIAWSLDDQFMFLVDSTTGIDVFDYDADRGTVSNRRRFLEVPKSIGTPDGMCIDDAGCLWVAIWGGGVVHRYTPSGELDTRVRLPVSNVSSVTFGGVGGDNLYISTAREDLGEDQLLNEPLAGGIFVARPGVGGAFAAPFGG